MATTIEVQGAPELAATLHHAAGRVENMAAVNREVAALVAAAARPPIRTGRLAASITPRSSDTEAAVTSGLVYAGVIEYGWPRRNIRPAKFLATAFAQTESATTAAYEKWAQGVLADVKGA